MDIIDKDKENNLKNNFYYIKRLKINKNIIIL